MSNVSKRRKECSRTKIKSVGDHKEFLKRITKTLYYGQLPTLPCLSLPVTEISCEVWSVPMRGRSLRRLHLDAAAGLARGACVSPCALVLALLYLERLHTTNPDYLANTPPADIFLVSLMVGNKFLQDDGEDDEVICSEWAASGGLDLEQLKKLEVDFLSAIDWKVFVNDKSFETGLRWLERQVALRQARRRGYFTYGDLSAACDAALLAAVAQAVAAAVAALLAAALVAAALVARAAQPSASAIATFEARVASDPPPLALADNATLEPLAARVLEEALRAGGPAVASPPREPEAGPPEPWWTATSLLGWLSRGPPLPMRRWPERPGPAGACEAEACVRWLNLSKLGAIAVSMSDR